MRRIAVLLVVLSAALFLACTQGTTPNCDQVMCGPDLDGSVVDVGTDVRIDAASDAMGSDAATDGSADAPADAPTDAPTDSPSG